MAKTKKLKLTKCRSALIGTIIAMLKLQLLENINGKSPLPSAWSVTEYIYLYGKINPNKTPSKEPGGELSHAGPISDV